MTCAGLAPPAKRIVEKVGKLCDSTTVTCAPESRSASRSASREIRRASGTSLGGVVELIVIPLPVQDTPLELLQCSPWRLTRLHVIFGVFGPPRSISSHQLR